MTLQTPIETIGIFSPGDMGHAIGREMLLRGLNVLACLQGRSARTRRLCQSAGIQEVASLSELVAEVDMLLSILVPSQAELAASEIAEAASAGGATTHFVECNAIAPDRVRSIEPRIRDAGLEFSDASIIGLPPTSNTFPRLYVSGPASALLTGLDGKGLNVRQLGAEIGQASGFKMCYAGLTKGTFALQYAVSIAARRLNLLEPLYAEFEFSQSQVFQRMQASLPRLPAKAWRWAGEMEEIASTFEQANVTPAFHEAAAAVYQLISQTSLGQETPETIDEIRTLSETIDIISSEASADRLS